MFILFVLLVLLLIFLGIIYYFFSLAFVRNNAIKEADFEDVDSEINKPLAEYKELMRHGIKFVKNQPHTWVFTTSYDGLKLAARYYDNSSDKTIILFHGYRSSATRDFSTAVKMYMNFGFNVLLCDQRCHGKSEGKIITFGVKESCDVISWINYFHGKYKTEKIILGGMSMGATTVLLSVGHGLPKTVKGIIADCGFTSPAEIIGIVAKKHLKINAKYILPLLNLYCLIIGKFSIYKANTAEAIKNSDIPILFVHGENDTFVPCEMSVSAYKNANENSNLVLVNGAEHGVSYFVDTKTVEAKLENFLKFSINL